ncbi:MAG TPA: cytochrome c biogenesis protein ResB [Micromonosporaceae bacterium]
MTAVKDRAAPPAPPPRRGQPALALLRNSWRQLTSMRTALVLLFLLAVAAIPGSVLPQRSISAEQVSGYFAKHPTLAPVLDRLGGFEVFASFWFSAIYLLLFTSLVGCILPRLREHVRALRSVPPAAPKRLDRLPQHAVLGADSAAGDLASVADLLRRRRWRVAVRGDTIAAEKGYLKETGNLLFHIALIAVLVGVALGSWYGWHGNRLLVAGKDTAFCNALEQYAESGLGPRVGPADLPGFCLELTDFRASYLASGQPTTFRATVSVDEGGRQPRTQSFSVNDPLRLASANVYLLGHGYAPMIRYTDHTGRAQTTVAPFLDTGDGSLTSEGVATFPDVNVDPVTGKRDPNGQVAFEGLYLPTAPDSPPYVRSQHPEERAPALMLFAYRGDLGLEAGIPGSVYRLDQRQIRTGKLKQVGQPKLIKKGEAWTLDDGTKVEFLGTRPYVSISIRHDPGSGIKLVSAGVLVAGLMLSLTGRRRRVWFRLVRAPAGASTTDGSSFMEVGGLPRTDYAGFAEEFRQLVAAVRGSTDPAAVRGSTGAQEGTD